MPGSFDCINRDSAVYLIVDMGNFRLIFWGHGGCNHVIFQYGGCVSIPTYVEYYYIFSQMNLFIFCREVISRQ